MSVRPATKVRLEGGRGAPDGIKRQRANHRLVKQNRCYAIDEAALVLGVHKNTVREWLKNGLTTIDDKRPMLISGRDLIAFLKSRKLSKKKPCRKGQLYCLRCRAPNYPAGAMLDFRPINDKVANAAGICPDCGGMMYRCVRSADLDGFSDAVRLNCEQRPPRLVETSQLSVNSDFTKEATHHAEA